MRPSPNPDLNLRQIQRSSLSSRRRTTWGACAMSRILGILVAIVGLFVAQSIYDFYLSRNYTEVEAILIAYEEDCSFAKDGAQGPYFDCGWPPKITQAGDSSDNKIERHATLIGERVPRSPHANLGGAAGEILGRPDAQNLRQERRPRKSPARERCFDRREPSGERLWKMGGCRE